MATFSAQIAAHVAKYEKRLEATFKSSAQQVAREATLPRSKGGNMRVKTGFLRASLMASTSAMPSINPAARPAPNAADESFPDDLGQINLVIAGSDLGQTIYLGFTASYARIREYEDGFVRLTAQRWQAIVDENARRAVTAFP